VDRVRERAHFAYERPEHLGSPREPHGQLWIRQRGEEVNASRLGAVCYLGWLLFPSVKAQNDNREGSE